MSVGMERMGLVPGEIGGPGTSGGEPDTRDLVSGALGDRERGHEDIGEHRDY
jgi:hypothetical protein